MPGWMRAKSSWEILPIAETGFKSVSPSDRTLRTSFLSTLFGPSTHKDAPEQAEETCEDQSDDGGPPPDPFVPEHSPNQDDA